jgi:acetylornithine deacetylase
MERLVRDVRADAAVVAEPTQLQIVVAHKGFVWIDIETKGVAAHGSKPELGVDAIAKMGKVLVELERIQEAELAKKRHTLVGAPSIHASTISGGRELSTYPDHCILQVERRIIPGENIDTVKAKFNSILNKISREDPKFTGSLSITFAREPMEVSTDEKICRVIQQSALEVTGIKPKYVGEDWWMDTQILWEKGIPAVAFGPTGNGSHSAIEYVITDSVIETARILERTAINFCV